MSSAVSIIKVRRCIALRFVGPYQTVTINPPPWARSPKKVASLIVPIACFYRHVCIAPIKIRFFNAVKPRSSGLNSFKKIIKPCLICLVSLCKVVKVSLIMLNKYSYKTALIRLKLTLSRLSHIRMIIIKNKIIVTLNQSTGT